MFNIPTLKISLPTKMSNRYINNIEKRVPKRVPFIFFIAFMCVAYFLPNYKNCDYPTYISL